MKNDKLRKKLVIGNFLNVLVLLIIFIMSYLNLEKMSISSDGVTRLFGVFGFMILPYIIIAIITQIVVLILNIINKQGKQSLNIVTLIVEIVYFIFTNFAVTPFMFSELFFFYKLLAYLVFLVFEILNIYIIAFSIKRIIQYKKGHCRYGK